MGRHPFSGQYLGSGIDMPIEKAIEQYRFAYGKNAKQNGNATTPWYTSTGLLFKGISRPF